MDPRNIEQWLDVIVDILASLGAGDYSARAPNPESNDAFGAVLFGLNILAEELEHIDGERQAKDAALLAKQKELETTQDELVRREKLAIIGELCATVSHELRNPLGTIRTSAHTVRTNLLSEGNRTLVNSLDRIDRNVDRCSVIIDELLDLTRRSKISPSPTKIDPWLKQLVEEFEYLADQSSTTVQAASEAELLIDPERLRRCVLNLLRNAREANPKRVEVGSRLTKEYLEISISDDGEGIPETERERVLGAFVTSKSFGVGLGLTVAKQVAEEHNGELIIESAPDRGTRVNIRLPSLGVAR